MLVFFTIFHVLLCVFMIFVILLQPGKDAGMGAALGGGAATSAFGGRGAVTFLSKLTAACAGLFFLTSLGLSFVGVRSSVAAGLMAPAAAPAPGAPVGAAPAQAPGTTAPPNTTAPATDAPTSSAPGPVSAPASTPPAPATDSPAPAKGPPARK
jgi:preprotein translocase subunit SecG